LAPAVRLDKPSIDAWSARRHAEAEAELAKLKAALGDAPAYQYATIYAQWGNTVKALESLDTAIRLRHPDLGFLKTAQGAALPGDRAGAEVPGVS
jgi:ABC-type cobalamin transport system ATPase subunit